MTTSVAPSTAVTRLGEWSALLTAWFTTTFTAAAILAESRLLPPPWDAVLPLAPLLLLATNFLAMLVRTNAVIPRDRRPADAVLV